MPSRPTRDQLAVLTSKSPVELEGDDLVANRLELFRRDHDWRERYADLNECARLYENRTDDESESNLPRRNLIRQVVDDHHAFAMANVPEIKLVSDRYIDPTENVLEREVAHMVMNVSEESCNAYVRTILRETDFFNHRDAAFKNAAIYGFGAWCVDVDRSADTRFSAELRSLMKKPLTEWTEIDANLYKHLSRRIFVKQVDSRDVFFQQGIRKWGPEMMRVSIVEKLDINTAKVLYQNDDISPSNMPHEAWGEVEMRGDIVSRLTTWERVPFAYDKEVQTVDGDTVVEVKFTAWVMVKTVIVGGQLIEKTIYGTVEADDVEEGSTALPVIPVYLKESENHPYGYALPLQLRLSEEFINRMYFIMYKSARKAVSNQAVLIHLSALGNGDIAKINAVLDEGGVAGIQGNDFQTHNPDLTKIVQPLNFVQSSLPSAMIEAVRNEESAFQSQSSATDDDAISKARSGAGKRAQVASSDRPKTLARILISRSLEDLYETVWDNVSIHHTEEVNVPVNLPGGGRQVIRLNQSIQRVIPIFDENGQPTYDPVYVSPENPSGLALKPIEFVLNSTLLTMTAQSDGRTTLPGDLISRLQILSALVEQGAITPDTLRDLTLPEEIRAIDEINRQKLALRQQQQMAQQVAAQQQQQGQPTFPALEQTQGTAPLLQDGRQSGSENDISDGVNDLLGRQAL